MSSYRLELLSVIIPAYNAADFLGEQFEALRVQDYVGRWEIVVVNNRSTDSTVKVIDKYQKAMPNLRLVPAMDKQGKGYTLNVGARAAVGNTFIFCDADDVAAPNWISCLAEPIKLYDVVAGAVEEEFLNRSAIWRPTLSNDGLQKYLETTFLGFLPFALGCNLAISRDAFEAVGGFCECKSFVCEDVDISWRLLLKGYTIHYAPEAVMHYRYRQTYRQYWNQVSAYAACFPLLYRRFKSYGMTGSSKREAVERYLWLLRKVSRLLSNREKARARWIYKAAASWGRVQGSFRHRTFYV